MPASSLAPEAATLTVARACRALGLVVVMEVRGERVRAVRLVPRDAHAESAESHALLDRVLAHLESGADDFADVPVDLDDRGAFERAVLDVVRTIPPGATLTYGAIARRVGKPGASRAVGNACARNRALVVVPCHRVVPASGGLGNYAGEGGAATKRALLEREGALTPTSR